MRYLSGHVCVVKSIQKGFGQCLLYDQAVGLMGEDLYHTGTGRHTGTGSQKCCAAHIPSSCDQENPAECSLVAAAVTRRKDICRTSVPDREHTRRFFKSSLCDADLGKMKDAGILSSGMQKVAAFIEGKGSCLVASDCTAHDRAVIRRDAGGDIHCHDICAEAVSASVYSLHAVRSFTGQFPGQAGPEKSVDDHIRNLPHFCQYGRVGIFLHFCPVLPQDILLYSKTAFRRDLSGKPDKADMISSVDEDPAGRKSVRTIIAPPCQSKDQGPCASV